MKTAGFRERREAQVKAFLNSALQEMMEYVKKEYSIREFDPKIIVRFDDRYSRSYGGVSGGRPFLSFAMKVMVVPSLEYSFPEYDHIKNDPEIGAVRGSWYKVVATLAAHEMAHAVEYMDMFKLQKDSSFGDCKDYENHGKIWQSIYRKLRNEFVASRAYREFDSTPVEVKAPSGRTRDTEYDVTRKTWNGGVLITYSKDHKNLGHIFQKKGQYLQYYKNGEWFKTTTTSVVEARKLFID